MRQSSSLSRDERISSALLKQFAVANDDYSRRFGHRLLFVDIEGKILAGTPYRNGGATEKERNRWRALAVSESLRWGQPSMIACPDDCMIWGVPVMSNNQVIAGMVVRPCTFEIEEGDGRSLSEKLTEACEDLLEIAEKHNLVNTSLMKLNRISAFLEREKAEAIHESKKQLYSDLREVYLLEELSLLGAIQQENRGQARAIINRILLHIYNRAPRSLNLLKSFAVELVVMMSRTAVDTGVDSMRIMAMNSSFFSALTRIDDEEELSQWLKNALERLMDEIHDKRSQQHRARLSQSIVFIEKHLSENISRDQVAKYCGLSPGHFSHLIRAETGKTFTEWLAFYRVRHACHLLARNQQSLAEIAAECGFADQSYFTKIFKKVVGQNPLQYRVSLTRQIQTT